MGDLAGAIICGVFAAAAYSLGHSAGRVDGFREALNRVRRYGSRR